MEKTFSIKKSIKFGWKTFAKHPFFWIVASLLSGMGSIDLDFSNKGQNVPSHFPYEWPVYLILWAAAIVIAISVAVMIVFSALKMGSYKAGISANKIKKPDWNILISERDIKRIFTFILVQLAYYLIIFGGLLLLILPGIYFAIKYQYAPIIFVHKNTKIGEAFEKSAKLTKGKMLKIFQFDLAIIGIIILGTIALGIGLLIALPVAYLANFYVYRKLLKNEQTNYLLMVR